MSMRIVLPVSSKITNAVGQAEDDSSLAALLVGDGRWTSFAPSPAGA
jgi:hypothetical protein